MFVFINDCKQVSSAVTLFFVLGLYSQYNRSQVKHCWHKFTMSQKLFFIMNISKNVFLTFILKVGTSSNHQVTSNTHQAATKKV